MGIFNKELKDRVLKRVIKKPRTGNEIGQPLGYSGRGVGRVLAELVKERKIYKIPSRPATYTNSKVELEKHKKAKVAKKVGKAKSARKR